MAANEDNLNTRATTPEASDTQTTLLTPPKTDSHNHRQSPTSPTSSLTRRNAFRIPSGTPIVITDADDETPLRRSNAVRRSRTPSSAKRSSEGEGGEQTDNSPTSSKAQPPAGESAGTRKSANPAKAGECVRPSRFIEHIGADKCTDPVRKAKSRPRAKEMVDKAKVGLKGMLRRKDIYEGVEMYEGT